MNTTIKTFANSKFISDKDCALFESLGMTSKPEMDVAEGILHYDKTKDEFAKNDKNFVKVFIVNENTENAVLAVSEYLKLHNDAFLVEGNSGVYHVAKFANDKSIQKTFTLVCNEGASAKLTCNVQSTMDEDKMNSYNELNSAKNIVDGFVENIKKNIYTNIKINETNKLILAPLAEKLCKENNYKVVRRNNELTFYKVNEEDGCFVPMCTAAVELEGNNVCDTDDYQVSGGEGACIEICTQLPDECVVDNTSIVNIANKIITNSQNEQNIKNFINQLENTKVDNANIAKGLLDICGEKLFEDAPELKTLWESLCKNETTTVNINLSSKPDSYKNVFTIIMCVFSTCKQCKVCNVNNVTVNIS